jgi:hypothetical protein
MRTVVASLLCLTLTACATVVGGREQEIAIQTTPEGAKCLISGTEGSWSIERTPESFTVPRSLQPLTVTCTLEGYQPATTILEAKTRTLSYANILMLGVPALLDAQTGAGYEYDPSRVMLNFNAQPAVNQ